jgi:hypothetical protein
MESVENLMRKGLKIVLDKCLPDLCEDYQQRFFIEEMDKAVFNEFIKKCFYYRFNLGLYPNINEFSNKNFEDNNNVSLDEILEEIAFNDISISYESKNKFYELLEEFGLNVGGQLDDLFMKYV